jgi:hypothetical protein
MIGKENLLTTVCRPARAEVARRISRGTIGFAHGRKTALEPHQSAPWFSTVRKGAFSLAGSPRGTVVGNGSRMTHS